MATSVAEPPAVITAPGRTVSYGGHTMSLEEFFNFVFHGLLDTPLVFDDPRRRLLECIPRMRERSIDMEHRIVYCGFVCVEEKTGTSS